MNPLLDTVEPDAWIDGAFYAHSTVVKLLAEYRKQVLLEVEVALNEPLQGDEPIGFTWSRRRLQNKIQRMMSEGEK